MRPVASATVLLLLAGCAQPVPRPSTPPVSTASRHVDPGNIRRVRRDLPPAYEVVPVSDNAAPQTIWGIGEASVTTPPRCAPLADPAGSRSARAQGFSASGAGGTVYAVVVAAPGVLAPDRSLTDHCQRWSIRGPRAGAHVHSIEAPRIDAADTLGMAVEIVSSVEGGNEISSQATTFAAYLGNYYAFTTLINDPGSPLPALPPQFAAELLVKTVSAIRG